MGRWVVEWWLEKERSRPTAFGRRLGIPVAVARRISALEMDGNASLLESGRSGPGRTVSETSYASCVPHCSHAGSFSLSC